MALKATVIRLSVRLSDVDRGVYEEIPLTLGRHPSESPRYLASRVLGYLLNFGEGVSFSRGGLSSIEEPPVAEHDPTGALVRWIDVNAPSADRLHRASKAAKVSIVSCTKEALVREAASRTIHAAEAIEVLLVPPSFNETLAEVLVGGRSFELVRTDGHLYVTASRGAATDHFDAPLEIVSLASLLASAQQ
jgi:uncharacterized protein YaeQ